MFSFTRDVSTLKCAYKPHKTTWILTTTDFWSIHYFCGWKHPNSQYHSTRVLKHNKQLPVCWFLWHFTEQNEQNIWERVKSQDMDWETKQNLWIYIYNYIYIYIPSNQICWYMCIVKHAMIFHYSLKHLLSESLAALQQSLWNRWVDHDTSHRGLGSSTSSWRLCYLTRWVVTWCHVGDPKKMHSLNPLRMMAAHP